MNRAQVECFCSPIHRCSRSVGTELHRTGHISRAAYGEGITARGVITKLGADQGAHISRSIGVIAGATATDGGGGGEVSDRRTHHAIAAGRGGITNIEKIEIEALSGGQRVRGCRITIGGGGYYITAGVGKGLDCRITACSHTVDLDAIHHCCGGAADGITRCAGGRRIHIGITAAGDRGLVADTQLIAESISAIDVIDAADQAAVCRGSGITCGSGCDT